MSGELTSCLVRLRSVHMAARASVGFFRAILRRRTCSFRASAIRCAGYLTRRRRKHTSCKLPNSVLKATLRDVTATVDTTGCAMVTATEETASAKYKGIAGNANSLAIHSRILGSKAFFTTAQSHVLPCAGTLQLLPGLNRKHLRCFLVLP